MMKYIYYCLVALEVFILVAIVYLSIALPAIFADLWQAFLCLTIGIPSVMACCIAIERTKTLCPSETVQQPDGNADDESSSDDSSEDVKEHHLKEEKADKEVADSSQEQQDETENERRKLWSQGMYQLYAQRWDDIFNNINHPVTPDECQKISLLLWEMASQTNDFLKVDNKDINKLQYQESNVKLIIGEQTSKDVALKDFYDDPETIEKRAIAIYHWLKAQGIKTNTTAFGYQLNIE